MFQKFIIYKITGLPDSADMLGRYLSHSEFVPTGQTQEKSFGWIPPRAKHGAFVESVGGQLIARLLIETRKVPSDALQRRIDEVVAAIERDTGRKPGRKERRDIKEAALLDLLPQAFPKQAAVDVWIDRVAGLLIIGSTSTAQVDDVVSALLRSVPDLQLSLVTTARPPVALMLALLMADEDDLDDDDLFLPGRECELRATDESNALVRYKNENLNREDVRDHITMGKRPTRMSLNWEGRIAFTLTEGMQFKSVEFLDAVFENSQSASDDVDDHFDADVAIATGELRKMLSDLFAALGGLVEAAPEPTNETPAPFAASDDADPLIDRARGLVIAHQKGSISLVQRYLQIGYNRAARLLDALETEGVVSPMRSNGTREVLIQQKEAA